MKSFMLMIFLLLTNCCFAGEIQESIDETAPPQGQGQPYGDPRDPDDPINSAPAPGLEY